MSSSTDQELEQKVPYDVTVDNNESHEDEVVRYEPVYTNNWYDRKLFGFLPRYSSGLTQVVMVSFICFLTPGCFNALSGIGGAGTDVQVADNANVALYSTFATFGFFSGAITNTIGLKNALAFGGTGYALYAASLLCYYHTQNSGFVIAAGAILGVCASCLWSAQSQIILSYPTEGNKGKAVLIFWVIFNLGAVIGSIIPLADNINSRGSSVSDGTYAAFLVLMIFGSVLAFFILPIKKVWRDDGTRVIYKSEGTWKTELWELWTVLRTEPKILLLFPMFFASNWFNTYQQSDFNAGRFNIRTRSLNSLLFWLMQMIGSPLLASLLDFKKLRRSVRAKLGWCVLFIITNAIWGGGLAFQLKFTRESALEMTTIDFTDREYIGPMFLYMFYGMFDAMWQTYLYYVMGALSNSARKLVVYSGFYKGIQSAGAAVIWRIDALELPYMNIFGSTWGLLGASLLIAVPLIFFDVEDHTELEKDLKDAGANLEDVISPTQSKVVTVTSSKPAV